MICKICGKEVEDGIELCPTCGAQMDMPQAEDTSVDTGLAEDTSVSAPKKSGSALGVVALIMGILSLVYPVFVLCSFCCNLIPILNYVIMLVNFIFSFVSPIAGVVGIVLGIVAKCNTSAPGKTDPNASVGLILSIIGLAAFAILLIVSVILVIVGMGASLGIGLLGALAESAASSYSYY